MKVSTHRFRFLVHLFPLLLYFQGKANFRNLARYSPFCERTFARHFQTSFDFPTFNQRLLEEIPSSDFVLLLTLDPSFVHKSGDSTYGIHFYYNGSASRTEKGLEINLVALVDLAADTAYALSVRQTPPPEEFGSPLKKRKRSDDSESSENTRMDFYLDHWRSCLPYLPKGRFKRKYTVVDGAFSKNKFVTGICDEGFHEISKLRKDADLWTIYEGEQKKRGRKRDYGKKVKFDNFDEWKAEGEVDVRLELYSRILYHKSLKRTIKVVALQWWDKKGKRHYVLLFSTDLEQEAWEIYVFYKSRFQMEFLFRDAKQYTGLMDCQARNKEALEFHFNASLSALNIAKIEERLKNPEAIPKPFSMASCQRRKFNEHLLEKIFLKLGFDATSIKSHPVFLEFSNYGTLVA